MAYLAIDLGAESGRAVLGWWDGARLQLREIHRFPNRPVSIGGTLYWDVFFLFAEIQQSLQKAQAESPEPVESVGVDTWGVDFALLDSQGRLLSAPVHYRDRRTEGMMECVLAQIPRETLYERTGIQFMPINTLYQLYSMVVQNDPLLDYAARLLMMPDLFHYWLTGVPVNEFTIATTSQCYDPRASDWAYSILEELGIPTRLFQPVQMPGTRLGTVQGSAIQVVLPASHDTASAVVGTPLQSRHSAYISSGTWSLVGVEVDAPQISAQSLAFNFTNEGGAGGRFRLLKNVMGLWLLQECRRTWQAQGIGNWDYAELTAMAQTAPAFESLIDPDDWRFLAPGDMPQRIQAYCAEQGQRVPDTPARIVRTILESLALKYRMVLEQIETLTGWRIETIHIVGGGAQNALLCQMTADATARPVLAGPIEATAIGNLMMQALGLGHIESLEAIRERVALSFPPVVYTPQETEKWETAYADFQRHRGRKRPVRRM
ncbi:MAG: rhamnulokinase [Fimbriimonadales bacterium]|nr:rhamnulokinase [Fimbriimonadales bacterium]GBC90795.1 L-Rhamnulokinase [bacterium HR14]